MIKYLFLISILTLSNCASSNDDLSDGISLIGKWKLVEYCMSPGDTSCPMKIPDFDQYFEFNDGNKFDFVGSDSRCSGIYEIKNKDHISFIFDDQACINESMRISIDNKDQIRINPPCREACIYIYKRQ